MTVRGLWPLRDLPAVVWLLAALVMTVVHPFVPESRWLMVHLLLLGALTHAVVVWSEHEGDGPMRIAARRTGAASEPWGPIEVLSPETGEDAVHPSVAMGPGDRAIAAWAQGPGAAQRVMIARVE